MILLLVVDAQIKVLCRWAKPNASVKSPEQNLPSKYKKKSLKGVTTRM